MQISVKSDVEKALKGKSRLHKKKMPFNAALGLTMTARKVAKVEQRMMVRNWIGPRHSRLKVLGGRALARMILKRGGCTHGFI